MLNVRSEKSELTEEANRIIRTIKQMEASLEDPASKDTYRLDEKELKITIPLTRCLQSLKEKHNAIAKVHRERFEQVKSKDFSTTKGICAKITQNWFRLSNHTLLTLNRLLYRSSCHPPQIMPLFPLLSTFRLLMSPL